jgi:hypothetical protein
MVVVDNCDAVVDWSALPAEVVISTSTDCVEGTGSIRVDVPSTVQYWAYPSKLLRGVNWTDTPLLSLWVKVSKLYTNPQTGVSLGLTVFWLDTIAGWYQTLYNITDMVVVGEWAHVTVDLRKPGVYSLDPNLNYLPPETTPNLSKIQAIRLDYYHYAGTADTLLVDLIEVETPVPRVISGIVRDSYTGNPLVGVQITADTRGPVYSQADGTFSITVPAGTYTLTFTKGGYQTKKVPVDCTAGDVTGLNVVLMPVAVITGTVTDTTTGKPISGVTVKADTAYSTTTDTNGFYRLEVLGGTYTLAFTKDGYTTYTRTLSVESGASYIVDVSLSPVVAPPPPTKPPVGILAAWNYPLLSILAQWIPLAARILEALRGKQSVT